MSPLDFKRLGETNRFTLRFCANSGIFWCSIRYACANGAGAPIWGQSGRFQRAGVGIRSMGERFALSQGGSKWGRNRGITGFCSRRRREPKARRASVPSMILWTVKVFRLSYCEVKMVRILFQSCVKTGSEWSFGCSGSVRTGQAWSTRRKSAR